MADRENVIEIFSSIQGEGKYTGCRQIFVRLEGCNLACRYCDTEHEPQRHDVCRVERESESRACTMLQNPMTAQEVAFAIRPFLEKTRHQAVSITGGEPLLHADFICALGALIEIPLFLETNGTLSENLESVLPAVDIISMDIKLPSELGGEVHWEEHRRFLEIAKYKDVYCKIVLTRDTTKEEFIKAVRLIAEADRDILLVLQPVTPFGGAETPSAGEMLARQSEALALLHDVRVIPQTHVLMGQR